MGIITKHQNIQTSKHPNDNQTNSSQTKQKQQIIMAAFEAILGKTLKNEDSDVDTQTALGDCDVLALYFSAHWCPPCRGFTPVFAETYKQMKKAGKKFETVFISSDGDESAFNSYFKEQPWLALPFAGRSAKASISEKYGVRGIPTLILLNKDGSIRDGNGRSVIMGDQQGASFPWAQA